MATNRAWSPVFSSSSLLLSSLESSDTQVYEPLIRALLGTAAHFCELVVLKVLPSRSAAVQTLRASRGPCARPWRRTAPEGLPVRIHFMIVMIRWTGLAPWEFEFHLGFPEVLARAHGDEARLEPRVQHPCARALVVSVVWGQVPCRHSRSDFTQSRPLVVYWGKGGQVPCVEGGGGWCSATQPGVQVFSTPARAHSHSAFRLQIFFA